MTSFKPYILDFPSFLHQIILEAIFLIETAPITESRNMNTPTNERMNATQKLDNHTILVQTKQPVSAEINLIERRG